MKDSFLAVINDEIMMMRVGTLNVSCRKEFMGYLAKISDAITKRVTNDPRFVEAVGKKTAKNACFHMDAIVEKNNPNGEEEQYLIYISMTVDNKKTDFCYEYGLISFYKNECTDITPYVMYKHGNKSYLMNIYQLYA